MVGTKEIGMIVGQQFAASKSWGKTLPITVLAALFVVGWWSASEWSPLIALMACGFGVIGWWERWPGVVILSLFVTTAFGLVSVGVLWSKIIFLICTAVCCTVPLLCLGWNSLKPRVWFRGGKLDPWSLVLAVALAAVSTVVVLVLVHMSGRQPEPPPMWMATIHPVWLIGGAAILSVANALFEEIVFRGIIMWAIQVEAGKIIAVVGQAVVFGAVHSRAIPGGMIGLVASAPSRLTFGEIRPR